MIKLIALFTQPPDTGEFDRHFFDIHLPLVRKIPGLENIEVTTVTGVPPGGTRYHLVAEMTFASLDAMNAAHASPEGKAVARDLMSFAADLVTLFYGEVNT